MGGMTEKKYLVFDIGGSSIKYALMGPDRILKKGDRIRTPKDHREGFLEILEHITESCQNEIQGIAVSAPGWIDRETGQFHHAGALHYLDGLNLPMILHEASGLPVTIENDANCAALAELHNGSLRDAENGLVLVIGTGVGAGLVLNHQLYRGSLGNAGEYGMMASGYIHASSPVGSLTCAHALLESYADMKGMDPEEIRGVTFFRLAEAGDETALRALDNYCRILARSMGSVHSLLDLEVIAIGGGYSREPLFLDYLNQALDAYCEPFVPLRMRRPKLTLCSYGNDANLFGALFDHLEH